MNRTGRWIMALGLIVTLAACGGTTNDPAATADGSLDGSTSGTAAKSGGGSTSTSTGARVSATDAVYGGGTTVSFWPGPYASSSLFVEYACTQNGAPVMADGSWELHYAVSNGMAFYSYVNDHYEVQYWGLTSTSYTGGNLDCVASGKVNTKKGPKVVASANFTIYAN